MAGLPTKGWSEEYAQSLLEQQICEQCELHGWATAVSVANPLDILIMFEDEDKEYTTETKKRAIA